MNKIEDKFSIDANAKKMFLNYFRIFLENTSNKRVLE